MGSGSMGRLGFYNFFSFCLMSFLSACVLIFLSACNSNKSDSSVARKVSCQDGVLHEVGVFGGKPVAEGERLSQGTVFILNHTGAHDLDGNEQMEMCTGSLVDKNIILTAAHCVPADEDSTRIEIAFSVDPICQMHDQGSEQALRSADRIIKHSQYQAGADGFTEFDLAMIRFQGQAPESEKILKLLTRSIVLDRDSKVIIAGYGQTTDYNQADTEGVILRTAQISPVVSSDDSKKITTSNAQPILYFDQTHGEGACAGDSGGPTLLQMPDSEYVIMGVNSAVDSMNKASFSEQNNVTCMRALRSASVYHQRDWIRTTHAQMKNENSTGLLEN